MRLYLGPYEKHNNWNVPGSDEAYGRKDLKDGRIYLVYTTNRGRWQRVNKYNKDFPTKEAAIADLDEYLLNELNAIFLTKEQYEKILVLI